MHSFSFSCGAEASSLFSIVAGSAVIMRMIISFQAR
jgi:hypothetical protein